MKAAHIIGYVLIILSAMVVLSGIEDDVIPKIWRGILCCSAVVLAQDRDLQGDKEGAAGERQEARRASLAPLARRAEEPSARRAEEPSAQEDEKHPSGEKLYRKVKKRSDILGLIPRRGHHIAVMAQYHRPRIELIFPEKLSTGHSRYPPYKFIAQAFSSQLDYRYYLPLWSSWSYFVGTAVEWTYTSTLLPASTSSKERGLLYDVSIGPSITVPSLRLGLNVALAPLHEIKVMAEYGLKLFNEVSYYAVASPLPSGNEPLQQETQRQKIEPRDGARQIDNKRALSEESIGFSADHFKFSLQWLIALDHHWSLSIDVTWARALFRYDELRQKSTPALNMNFTESSWRGGLGMRWSL